MGYQIDSIWTKLRKNDIEKLNKILDNEYYREMEISEKLYLMSKFQKCLDDELESLKIDEILKYMRSQDWRWANSDDTLSVPTKERMLDDIRLMFNRGLYKFLRQNRKEDYGIEGGGLVVTMGIDPEPWVRIYFDIAH